MSSESFNVSDSTDMSVEQLSPSKARQILDRVDLLSKIREDILSHPHLEERLSLCQPSADTPDWWQPGKHDKELLLGAAKHGLGRTDITILNDPDFSFHKVLGKSIYNSVQAAKNLDKSEKAIKIENREDILKFDKDEILVKLEKGEGTLKIEKVGIKKDKDAQVTEKKSEILNSERGQVELTLVKAENFSETKVEDIVANNGLTITTVMAKSPEKEVLSAKEEIEEEKSSTDIPKEEHEKENILEVKEKEVSAEFEEESKSSEEEGKDKEDEKAEKSEIIEEVIKDQKEAITTEEETEKEEEEKELDKPMETPVESILKENEKQKEEEEEKQDALKAENVDEAPKEKRSEDAADKEEEPVIKDAVKDEVKAQEEKEVDITKEKTTLTKIEDKCSVQAAELKAMFPDLEVIQPLSRLTQIDTFVLRDKTIDYTEPTVAQLLAHSYQSSVKWPKEHAIEARLRHIVHAVEQKEWPVSVNFTAGDETELMLNEKDNSDVITITTDHGVSRSLAAMNNISAAKKRKRHIAIDVETERAKLHALLNSSHMTSQPPTALSKPTILSGSNWEANEESQSEESRRSTPVQPPPAHQQARTPAIPFDLKYTVPGKTTVIPGTSSTLTPIDLSAG